MDQVFSSFEEAEIFIKRKYQAWLDRDEGFVNYLINEVNKVKKK